MKFILNDDEVDELRLALKARLTTFDNFASRAKNRIQRAVHEEQADKVHALYEKLFPGELPKRVKFAPLPAAPWKKTETA